MHVLHVETGRHLYGGALQVLYLLEGLKAKGVKNTLVCSKGSEISAQAERFARVRAVPLAGDLDPTFLPRLLMIVLAEKPDILHAHSRRGADLWGGLAARLTRTRAVVTRRVDNPEPPRIAGLKYRLYDRVISISKGIRQVLLSEGVPPGKIRLVHSAVDCGRYSRPCQNQWFYSEFGLSAGNRVIGTVAQLIPRKGHRHLIEAAPRILEAFPETRFLFFGKGPLKKELQDLCRASGLGNLIRFAGFRPDLERILPCLDLVVHPADLEGLGVSLLQAAAAGVPIVAARVGGIPEIVHNGTNGYLVDAGDVEGIVHAVSALLRNPAMAKRFGRAGRERIREKFSTEAMVRGNLEAYRGVLSGGFPGRR